MIAALVAQLAARRPAAIRRRLAPRHRAAGRLDRALADALADAGWPIDACAVRRARLATVGLPAVGLVLAPSVAVALAIPAVVALGPGPAVALRLLAGRRRARRDLALPAALEVMAAALRAGASLGGAVRDAAAGTRDAGLRAELAGVVAALDAGQPIAEAVEGWRAGAGARAVDLVASALVIAAEAGGEVARSIDSVAASLRERRELAAEAASLSTQARASAVVLAVAPLGFGSLTALADPEAAAFLVSTAPGLGCLASGLSLLALGAWWMGRIVRAAT